MVCYHHFRSHLVCMDRSLFQLVLQRKLFIDDIQYSNTAYKRESEFDVFNAAQSYEP